MSVNYKTHVFDITTIHVKISKMCSEEASYLQVVAKFWYHEVAILYIFHIISSKSPRLISIVSTYKHISCYKYLSFISDILYAIYMYTWPQGSQALICVFNWIITLHYTNMSYNNNTPIVEHIITTYKLICMFFKFIY
jgi:hypothetical protein